MASATLPRRRLSTQVALRLHLHLIEITQLLGVRTSLQALLGRDICSLSCVPVSGREPIGMSSRRLTFTPEWTKSVQTPGIPLLVT